jgi:hypothetical protein
MFINNLDLLTAPLTVVKKFADEIMRVQVQGDDNGKQLLQYSLNKLSDWTLDWAMAFNIKRCMLMHFGTKNKQQQYYMEGEHIGVMIRYTQNTLPCLPKQHEQLV